MAFTVSVITAGTPVDRCNFRCSLDSSLARCPWCGLIGHNAKLNRRRKARLSKPGPCYFLHEPSSTLVPGSTPRQKRRREMDRRALPCRPTVGVPGARRQQAYNHQVEKKPGRPSERSPAETLGGGLLNKRPADGLPRGLALAGSASDGYRWLRSPPDAIADFPFYLLSHIE